MSRGLNRSSLVKENARWHYPLVAMLWLVLSGSGAAAANATDPFISAIEDVKRSVVPVVCMKPRGPSGASTPMIDGTAFFISRRGEFVTAAHVIRDFTTGQNLNGCTWGIWFAAGRSDTTQMDFNFFPIRRCIFENRADIARCATDDLTLVNNGKFAPAPLEIDTDRRADGWPIAVTGYPFSSVLPITSRGYIGGYLASPEGVSQMVLDHAAWPGGSGSPVYDARRKVLGIVTQAGEGMASGLSFARTGGAIAQFLATRPLPPPGTTPPNQAVPNK